MLIARVATAARSAMSKMACCVWRYINTLFEVKPVTSSTWTIIGTRLMKARVFVFASGKSKLRSRATKMGRIKIGEKSSHTYIRLADFFSFSVIVNEESAPGSCRMIQTTVRKNSAPQMVHKAITSAILMNANGLCQPVCCRLRGCSFWSSVRRRSAAAVFLRGMILRFTHGKPCGRGAGM